MRWSGPVAEIQDGDVPGAEGRDGRAVVEEGGDVGGGFFAGEGFEVADEVAVEGHGGLDFDGADGGGFVDEQVDFEAFFRAEEGEGGVFAGVEEAFADVHDAHVFEEGAAQGVGGELGGGADAEEMGGEAGFGEVDFGGFDDALGEVGEPGFEAVDEEGGFEDGEPGGDGRGADARFACEGGKVHDLPDASGQQGDETLEENQVADVDETADVAFDVGAEVIPVVAGGVLGGGVEFGHEAPEEQFVGGGAPGVAQFGEGEGEQFQDGGPSCEGFVDGFGQFGLVGAGQDEASASTPVGVDLDLDLGGQGRDALDFVEDDRRGVAKEKSLGVGGGQFAFFPVFEVDIAEARATGLGQRGLARLARAKEGDDGEFRQGFAEGGFDFSLDHGGGSGVLDGGSVAFLGVNYK